MLFLDEIGDLALDLQGKLLRVLQERRVLTVGEDQETAVDVRVVCATHRDLPAMVREGRFREDLWQRLSVVNLRVPALHERRSDIPALVDSFLAKHALSPGEPRRAAPEYLDALMGARLTGNVRQLENLVRRSLAVAEHDRPLGLADLPPSCGVSWPTARCRRKQASKRGRRRAKRRPRQPFATASRSS